MKSEFWNQRQIALFADQIEKSDAGRAWDFLVPAIRHAVVEAKILTIVRNLDRESVPQELIEDLSVMLHDEMGTADSFGM